MEQVDKLITVFKKQLRIKFEKVLGAIKEIAIEAPVKSERSEKVELPVELFTNICS